MLRHFSTSGDLWCVQTFIVLHWPTSADASLLHGHPRYAHKYSQRAQLLWKTVIGRRRPIHSDEVWMHHYGAFILPSLYIGRRLSTSLDVALHRWAMPQRQDLASLGIGRRWTSTDAQRWSLNAPLWCVQTSIILHRPTSVDASLLWDYPRYAHKHSQGTKLLWTTSIGRRWRCTAMKSECTIMVRSDFIAVHWSTSADARLSQQLCALRIIVRVTRVAM